MEVRGILKEHSFPMWLQKQVEWGLGHLRVLAVRDGGWGWKVGGADPLRLIPGQPLVTVSQADVTAACICMVFHAAGHGSLRVSLICSSTSLIMEVVSLASVLIRKLSREVK